MYSRSTVCYHFLLDNIHFHILNNPLKGKSYNGRYNSYKYYWLVHIQLDNFGCINLHIEQIQFSMMCNGFNLCMTHTFADNFGILQHFNIDSINI